MFGFLNWRDEFAIFWKEDGTEEMKKEEELKVLVDDGRKFNREEETSQVSSTRPSVK